uniref:Uncharacterized protein n=1 Tax=Biomphalaria glabrata TaxID=6526 RepID=A0A2C9M385_BIOGL
MCLMFVDIKKKCDICVDEETPKDTNSCNEDSSRITDLSILKMKHEETLNDLRKCQAEMRRMSSEIEKLKSTMNNYTLNSDVVFKGKDEEEEDAADSQVRFNSAHISC